MHVFSIAKKTNKKYCQKKTANVETTKQTKTIK